MSDGYFTIRNRGLSSFLDKGSKFYGFACHATSVEQVQQELKDLRNAHPSARHICYAYRIQPEHELARDSDDGEPSSSAGKPIAGQIRSAGLMNVLVAVVRYFGGTLLGVPGLIHAYRETARAAIEQAEIVREVLTRTFRVSVSYDQSGELMKRIKQSGYQWDGPFKAGDYSVILYVPRSAEAQERAFMEAAGWIVSEI